MDGEDLEEGKALTLFGTRLLWGESFPAPATKEPEGCGSWGFRARGLVGDTLIRRSRQGSYRAVSTAQWYLPPCWGPAGASCWAGCWACSGSADCCQTSTPVRWERIRAGGEKGGGDPFLLRLRELGDDSMGQEARGCLLAIDTNAPGHGESRHHKVFDRARGVVFPFFRGGSRRRW